MEMMIDIETLDTKTSAVVLSIGAVAFDEMGRVHERFYRILDVDLQLERGRTVSLDTIRFWMDQDRDARDEAFSTVRVGVGDALTQLNMFCRMFECNRYWALGPQFDYTILEDLYRTMLPNPPWSYGQIRDVRTLCDEAKIDRKNHTTNILGLPHTPVYDCEYQIELLTIARKRLQNNRKNA